MSADALRSIPSGGEWLAMTGSPWLRVENGDAGGLFKVDGLTMGDKNVALYGVLRLEAEYASDGGPAVKSGGSKSNEFTVVADLGPGLKSYPAAEELIVKSDPIGVVNPFMGVDEADVGAY